MFRYRLQPLLRYRKNLEDDQQRQLAAANRELFRELGVISDREKKRLAAMARILRGYEEGRQDPGILVLYDRYLDGLSMDAANAAQRAERARLRADVERQKLMELVKKRRTLELHRDRLKERYDKEEDRSERIASDEMAIMRHSRPRRENEMA